MNVHHPHGWYVKKEITISHLVTTISVAVGIFYWSSDVNNQIMLLHREDQILQERIADTRTEQRAAYQDIRGALLRIEEKLDHKADRR